MSLSWNRIPRVRHAREISIGHRFTPFPQLADGETCIPYGNGRSYGDVCLDPDGVLLKTRRMEHFISFDRTTGSLSCEAGVLLSDILDLVVPQGWFLPVSPGTRFATVGGAVANDVHGKNHHVAGTFGHHLTGLELLRSSGERLACDATQNADWFRATIGGLGLTGLITRIDLQLMPVANPFMQVRTQRFRNLAEFWQMNREAEDNWPYTVAWLDCTRKSGRGILFGARHAPPQPQLPSWSKKPRNVPIDPPFSLINRLSLHAFNTAYFRRPLSRGNQLAHYVPFFYPLDSMSNWNRLYGRRGFFQYQCVIPPEAAPHGVAEILSHIVRSGQGSILSVLKTFGSHPPAGMLSFPRPGATLALDFANAGAATLALFDTLDSIVQAHGGALYPAKDARMSAAMFRAGYPQLEEFSSFVDPRHSSGFWRRVTES